MYKKKLSIVIPVYNEEQNIHELCGSIDTAMSSANFSPKDFEVLVVNDGSHDHTLAELKACKQAYPYLKIISFRRNFGQTAAISAGFDYADGEVIIPMDGDLQNDPKDIPRLLEKLSEGYDVVSGWRKDRQDTWLTRKVPSWLANKLISFISGVKLHDYGCTLKAYRADYVKDIRLYGEMHRFIPIYMFWEGATIAELPVAHHPRRAGKSKYGLLRTFKVILDLITIKFMSDFSQKPIYFFGSGGLILFFGGVLVSLKVFYQRIVLDIPGINLITNLLLVVLFFISAFLFIALGILAEILMRIFHASQDKKIYRVDTVL